MFKKIIAVGIASLLIFGTAEPAFAKGFSSSQTRSFSTPKISTPSKPSSPIKSNPSSSSKVSSPKNSTTKPSTSTNTSKYSQPKSNVKPGTILSASERNNSSRINGVTYNGLPVFLTAAGTYFVLSNMNDDNGEEAVVINEDELQITDSVTGTNSRSDSDISSEMHVKNATDNLSAFQNIIFTIFLLVTIALGAVLIIRLFANGKR